MEPFGADAAGGDEDFAGGIFSVIFIKNADTDVILNEKVFDFGIGDESDPVILEIFLEFGNDFFDGITADVLSAADDELDIGAFGFFDHGLSL